MSSLNLAQIKAEIDDAVNAAVTIADFVVKYDSFIPGAAKFAPELAELDKVLHTVQALLAQVP